MQLKWVQRVMCDGKKKAVLAVVRPQMAQLKSTQSRMFQLESAASIKRLDILCAQRHARDTKNKSNKSAS
jgi:hypothetical protein